MRQEQLPAYLKESCRSRKHRIGSAELGKAMHLRGADLRKLVNRLRQKGVPIASDRQGYFYAAIAGEVCGAIRQLRQMADGLEKVIAGLESALETFGETDNAGDDGP